MKKLKKSEDVEGKLLVSKGAVDPRSVATALRLKHSDPSRRNSETIDLMVGGSYRIPEDISVSDARVLLQSEQWKFSLKDRPAEKAAPAKKEKEEPAAAEVVSELPAEEHATQIAQPLKGE